MEAVNCPRCGKIFTKFTQNICPNCVKAEEDLFAAIKEYIDEYPNCTVAELSVSVGVSAQKIMRFIKEGRLEISKGMRGEIRCEKCNKPITRGRYCDSCVIEINQDVNAMFKREHHEKKNAGTGMHIKKKL